MRWIFPAAAALVLGLLASAVVDPALPFLAAGPGFTWWVHPEPLAIRGGGHGPHRLGFRFTPARAGELTVAAMSSFRLRDGATVLGASPEGSWKRRLTLRVPARPLEVEASDPRLLPALGLGGEAAPAAVTVERDGSEHAAVRADDGNRPRQAFSPRAATALRTVAAGLALLLIVAAIRGRRNPGSPAPSPHALLVPVVALVAAHAAIGVWNVATYPIDRGLDAEGHREYVALLVRERRLPSADRGWQTYHPPLYHALAAAAFAVTGRERSLQAVSALAGVGLVAVAAAALGRRRWRGLALLAFLPVLLISEPQATNEVLFACLATAALAVMGGERWSAARAIAAGLLVGLGMLTKYTGVLLLPPLALAALHPGAPGARTIGRARALTLALLVALVVGGAPYVSRFLAWGDPFVGNWNDALGHPYRQPPGVRTAGYFTSFGSALVAHPFAARDAALADALYVSTFGDGFARFLGDDRRLHAAQLALAWLAFPLALTAVLGGIAATLARAPPSRLEACGVLLTVLALSAVVRFNLELPYWSTAKGVFLLALALPFALAFERGRALVAAGGGRLPTALVDFSLAGFAALSAWCFTYR